MAYIECKQIASGYVCVCNKSSQVATQWGIKLKGKGTREVQG